MTSRVLALLVCACLLSAGCGTDRRARALQACREAELLVAQGAPDKALDLYAKALEYNPYLAQANFGYARLLVQRRGAYGQAAGYFRRCADLEGEEQAFGRLARRLAEVSTGIAEGTLEAPVHAVEDLFWAVGNGSEQQFAARLDGGLTWRLVEEHEGTSWLLAHWRSRYGEPRFTVLRQDVDAHAARVRVALTVKAGGVDHRDLLLARAAEGDWLLAGFHSVERKTP